MAGKPELKVIVNPVSCYGKADGEINIVLPENSPAIYKIAVIDSSSRTLVKFDNSTKSPFEVKNLKAGPYQVLYTWEDKTEEYKINIISPDLLKANIISIKELKGEGTNITGTLQANPSGGNLPYSIIWSDNTGKQTGYTAKDLPEGIYRCTIEDSKNCASVTATFFLYQDEINKYEEKTKHN
jgi:hypothetical protein